MKKNFLLLALSNLTVATVQASNSSFEMSCHLDNGKQVKLTENKTKFHFQFGNIKFSEDKKVVFSRKETTHNPASLGISFAINLKNKGNSYTLFVHPSGDLFSNNDEVHECDFTLKNYKPIVVFLQDKYICTHYSPEYLKKYLGDCNPFQKQTRN